MTMYYGPFHGGVSTGGNTLGTTGTVGGQIIWVGGANITLSQSILGNQATVTIIGGAGGGGGNFSAGVSTGGNTSGSTGITGTQLVFAGGNNITLSQSTDAGGGTVTISALNTVAQSVQTLGGYALGNTTGESSSSTWDARTLSLRGDGIVSLGWSNSTFRISATQSNQNVTAGNGGFAFQTLSFSDANGFSFGTSAGSAITGSFVRASFGDSTGGNTAGDSGVVTGRLVLAGGNNITLSGSTNAGSMTITVSGPNTVAQSNQTGEIYHVGNTTGESSRSTFDARTLSFRGDGIVSVGWSNSSVRFSATQSNQAFSAAGGASNFQTLSFSDNPYASWTNNAGQVALTELRASLFAVSNTTQSSSGTQNLDALSFAGAGIASVGVTGGSVVVSVPAGGGAGDGGVFAGVSTMGNTAGSTGTVSTGNFVLVGSDGISLSQSTGAAGSEATVTFRGYLPRINIWNNLVAAGDSGNEPHRTVIFTNFQGSLMVVPLVQAGFGGPFPGQMTCNTAYMRISLSGSTATMSQAFTSTFSLGIYTETGSTLSLLNSATTTFGSNAANANLSTQFVGNRYLTWGTAAWSSSPVFAAGSVYYLATNFRTSGVSNQSATFIAANHPWASNSASHSGTIGVATANATTMGIYPWFGVYGTTTTGMPSSIASNQLNKQAAFNLVPLIIFNEAAFQSF